MWSQVHDSLRRRQFSSEASKHYLELLTSKSILLQTLKKKNHVSKLKFQKSIDIIYVALQQQAVKEKQK